MNCKSCGLEKDPSLFYKSRQNTCKECAKAESRTYRKEKINEHVHQNGRYLLELWRGVVKRCRNTAGLISYKDSSNLFEDFEQFSEWCGLQYGHNSIDSRGRWWVLDKDIIKVDNVNYGPDLCCFVPTEINLLVAYRNAERRGEGDAPIGTIKTPSGKYRANFGNKSLGNYSTPEEAHFAWCDAKVTKILDVVHNNVHGLPQRTLCGLLGHVDFIRSYRDRGLILPRVKGAQTVANRLLIDDVVMGLIESAHTELQDRGLEVDLRPNVYSQVIKECFYETYKT